MRVTRVWRAVDPGAEGRRRALRQRAAGAVDRQLGELRDWALGLERLIAGRDARARAQARLLAARLERMRVAFAGAAEGYPSEPVSRGARAAGDGAA